MWTFSICARNVHRGGDARTSSRPHAPGFIPGGQSIGGAPEWMLDNKAMSRGLIDINSLQIRELPNP
jgi:hypothetical protein